MYPGTGISWTQSGWWCSRWCIWWGDRDRFGKLTSSDRRESRKHDRSRRTPGLARFGSRRPGNAAGDGLADRGGSRNHHARCGMGDESRCSPSSAPVLFVLGLGGWIGQLLPGRGHLHEPLVEGRSAPSDHRTAGHGGPAPTRHGGIPISASRIVSSHFGRRQRRHRGWAGDAHTRPSFMES